MNAPPKKSAPAEIVHFPKRAKAARRRDGGEPKRREPSTDPDLRPGRGFDEELVTEPEFFPPTATPTPSEGTPANVRRPIWIDARAHHKGLPKGASSAKSAKGAPKAPRARKQGKAPTAAEIAERSTYGHQLFELGRLDEAREVFKGLVELGVEDSYAHTMLGTIHLALDQQDKALELFEVALALNSTDVAARVYRGEIRLNLGKLNLAIDDLQLAVRLGPKDDPFVARARRLIQIAREVAASGKSR